MQLLTAVKIENPIGPADDWHADISPGSFLVIYGHSAHCGGPYAFSRRFQVGDTASLGGRNMTTVGKITSIGAKTVAIQEPGEPVRRLKLWEFVLKNYALDLAKIAQRNEEASQCL